MRKTGSNWFGPVFGGFWRFRSGFFCISKLGNRLRFRFTQKRQKNRTGPDRTSFHYSNVGRGGRVSGVLIRSSSRNARARGGSGPRPTPLLLDHLMTL